MYHHLVHHFLEKAILKRTSIVFALYFIVLSAAKMAKPSEIPKFRFNLIGESWTNLSKEGNTPIIFAKEADEFILECHAPYPIQWNISGLISPLDAVQILPITRNMATNTFKISVYVNFFEHDDRPDVAASARFACEMVSNYEVRNEKLVILRAKGDNPFVKPKSKVVVGSKLIPCATTDPTTPVQLRRTKSERGESVITDVSYDPTEGFRSNSVFEGVYTCYQDSFSESFTAHSTSSMESVSDQHFSPSTGNIKVFSNEKIEFRCSSRSKPLKLEFDENMNVTFRLSTSSVHNQVAQLAVRENVISATGHVRCIEKNLEIIIKQWSYEFIDPPELYFDNYAQEIHCLSTGLPKAVQTIVCNSGMECHYMKQCLNNASLCNLTRKKQYHVEEENEKYCTIREMAGESKSCVSIPSSHYNGLVQCTVSGLTKTWDFFTSLSSLRYSSWKQTPESDLLRMDDVPETLYTNNTAQFFCVASAYHFADSIAFEVEYVNGSKVLLENDGISVNYTIISESNPIRKIQDFNIASSLNINLHIDTVGVHCLAPWWNSTDIMRASKKFKTRQLLKPELRLGSGTNVKEMFYTGHTARLTCPVLGEPQPEYTWLFEDKNASEVFPELTTSTGANGEGYLEFLPVYKKYSGEFICKAENMIGHATRRYTLDVTDESLSSASVAYIAVGIIVLLILALVVAALVLYVRRYNEAKELIRGLTDTEVEEFFMGKPELLTAGKPNSVDTIEFLPYKKEYEIPISDIQYDSSDSNLLGSGEFSYVIRAKVISNSKEVALKISKPSADVSIFKTLLSEVKIMLYIGTHDNVVTLVGVCTEGIRNRNIYIATEICELGSLDRFLLKARPNFANLMDANQQIDIKSLPQETSSQSHVTTLDLINFAAQIATGMEYLSYKSVVHADLATRNVLLTCNKTAKISDFGLSRKLYQCNNYVKKSKSPLPWRWMAIEALTTLTFSTQSDIWSYGVTLFEIFTLGDIPFPNEEWDNGFIMRLSSGMRMGRPKYSTQEIYLQLISCWEDDPQIRPSFTGLKNYFEQQLMKFRSEKIE